MSEGREYIVLVGEAQGYLLMSIKEKLKEAAFDVSEASVDIAKVSNSAKQVKAFLVYADEAVIKNQQLLVYLKDKAAEEDLPVFVIGNESDIKDVKKVLPAHLIQKEFRRPVNVKDMVEEIRDYMSTHDMDKKKKILVVDDSSTMLHSIKNWLGDKYHITLADSGLTAIKYMALNRPDLILLDYEMPICDGRQTLEMIRAEKEFANIPVIFLTGKGDKESIMKVMGLKPEGYLLKSLKPGEVRESIDNFFEKKKADVKVR